jgi:hypothetical protein
LEMGQTARRAAAIARISHHTTIGVWPCTSAGRTPSAFGRLPGQVTSIQLGTVR